MSKFAQAIIAHETRERRALAPKLRCVITNAFEPVSDVVMDGTVYRIGVLMERKVIITDKAPLSQGVRMARKAIIEEVFGEFRPYFRRIEEALWRDDFRAATQLLNELQAYMYSDEVNP